MNKLTDNPYLQDILSQGRALKTALGQFKAQALRPLKERILRGDFDRIVLTGMGGSYFSAYPVWLILVNAGLPAMLVDCAELIHHSRPLITNRTLVWVTSQSGQSAEIISVLELIKQKGATLLATVNDLDSPLAQAGGKYVIPIGVETEKTVSTRTYINSLALGQLAALTLIDAGLAGALEDLAVTASGLIDYLSNWEPNLHEIQSRILPPDRLILLGRGPSLAAANAGALILGEASKFAAIGMQAGEFRHGPLELASPDLTVLIFGGPPETRELNSRLHRELRDAGVQSFWISMSAPEDDRTLIPMPHSQGIGIPLAEIVPIQMLTIHIAEAGHVEPGRFFRIGKITLNE